MKVYKQVICTTSDTCETVTVDCGDCQAPFAFSLNHDAYGYGKFVIDEMSLTAMEQNLKLIESRLNRKQTYFMLYDMIKTGEVSGARVMKIIANNLQFETAEDILSEVLQQFVPAIISKYLPFESYIEANNQMFETCRTLLGARQFTEESTQQMLVTALIGFAQGEDQRLLVHSWFVNDSITDLQGTHIIKLTLKQMH
jgi:hypothetical protein